MKKFLLALTLALTALTASAASNDYYVEAKYGVINLKGAGLDATSQLGMIAAGVNVTDIWALEATAGKSIASGDGCIISQDCGVSTTDPKYHGTKYHMDVPYTFGLFIKGNYEVTDNLKLFGRVGMLHAKLRVDAPSLRISASDSDTGFAYGVGAQYDVTNKVYATVDYMDYSNVSKNLDASGPSIGVGYKF